MTGSESLLHAHAELFLTKGYAAWNLTGQSRLAFEERLKRFSDPSIASLFTRNAPVCTINGNEILQGEELRERIRELEQENANFKAIAEQASEEMLGVRDELVEKTRQLELVEYNLKASIDAGLASKDRELEELRNSTDVIVASALQEQKEKCNPDPAELENLRSYVRILEKRQVKLEHYLLLAKEALEEKQAPLKSEPTTRMGEYTQEANSNMFQEEIHRKTQGKSSCSIQ